jgi:hypothetical protein
MTIFAVINNIKEIMKSLNNTYWSYSNYSFSNESGQVCVNIRGQSWSG